MGEGCFMSCVKSEKGYMCEVVIFEVSDLGRSVYQGRRGSRRNFRIILQVFCRFFLHFGSLTRLDRLKKYLL